MQILCILESVGESRTFQVAGDDILAVDLILKSGSDVIIATAFDKLADRIIKGGKNGKKLFSASLTFATRTKDERTFQSCRLNDLVEIFELEPQAF